MTTPLHEDDCTLTVSSLGRNIHEEHLKEIFGYYGDVTMVNLAMDKAIGFPKGYAYIRFSNRKDAERAKERLNGGQIDGKVIKVDFILVPRQPLTASRFRAKSPIDSQRRHPVYTSRNHTAVGRRRRRFFSPISDVSVSRRKYSTRNRRFPDRSLRNFHVRESSYRPSFTRFRRKSPSQQYSPRRQPLRRCSRSRSTQRAPRRFRSNKPIAASVKSRSSSLRRKKANSPSSQSRSSSSSRSSDSSVSRRSSSNASHSSHSRPSSSTVSSRSTGSTRSES